VSHDAWFQVVDLSVSRGPRQLLDRLGFSLERGVALLLRGPNGCGKSSLLRALLGLTPATSGEIRLDAGRFTPGSGRLCPLALYQGHATGLKGELTALENLALAAGLDGSPTDQASLLEALARTGLPREARIPARRLSQGQKQRLALARLALPNHRTLWLLDEPSAALDSAGAELLDGLIDAQLRRGGGALIATHLPLLAGRPTRTLTLG